MTRLVWDDLSSRNITAGVDRGVFYPPEGPGVAWSGLVSIETSVDSHETRSYFLNGQKVHQDPSSGDYQASITAYTYPDILETNKIDFGLCYRSYVRTDEREYYRLHILYGLYAVDKELTYSTIGETVEPTMFEWDISSLPARFDGFRPTNHLIVDSRYAYPWLMSDLENTLYGSDLTDPVLPSFEQLLDIFEQNSILKITNHGDGTWTAEGPPVYIIGPTEFGIDWPSVTYLDLDTYKVSSL